MALTARMIEELAEWCLYSDVLAEVRSKARSEFFGYDEPGTVYYQGDTGSITARNRRLAGWFGFYYRLHDGTHPAETAANALLSGKELESALKSIQACRYVMAMAKDFIRGDSLRLKLEDELFQVQSRTLSQELYTSDTICAHIMPIGRIRWLVCPGWVVLPIHIGRNMRTHLKEFQPTPIEIERLIQNRPVPPGVNQRIEHPKDNNLCDAVARMTKTARAEGKEKLIKSVEEWQALVLTRMKSQNFTMFSKDVIKLVGKVSSVDEANRWLGLAINIWNNTPQPDRGGKSANDMMSER